MKKTVKKANFVMENGVLKSKYGNVKALQPKSLTDYASIEKTVKYEKIENITAENIYFLASCIAIANMQTILSQGGKAEEKEDRKLLNGGGFSYTYKLYTSCVNATLQGFKDYKTILAEGADIIHTALLFLLENMGKRVDDMYDDSHNVLKACFRCVNAYITSEKRKQYKQIYIDDCNESDVVIEIPELYDIPTVHDYNVVKRVIEKLNLSVMENRVIKKRFQGKSLDIIAEELNIKKGSLTNYLKRIREKVNRIYGVDESTQTTANELRKAENKQRKTTENALNKGGILKRKADKQTQIQTYKTLSTIEKINVLKRKYANAKKHENVEKMKAIKHELKRLYKRAENERMSEKKQNDIEKRIKRLVNQCDSGMTE